MRIIPAFLAAAAAVLVAACSAVPGVPGGVTTSPAPSSQAPAAVAPSPSAASTAAPVAPEPSAEPTDDAWHPAASWQSLPPGDGDPLYLGQATRIDGDRTMAVYGLALGTRSTPGPDDSEWWVLDLELCVDPAADGPVLAGAILPEIAVDTEDGGFFRPFRDGGDAREVFLDPERTIDPGDCLRGPVLIPVIAGSTPVAVRLFGGATQRRWLLEEK